MQKPKNPTILNKTGFCAWKRQHWPQVRSNRSKFSVSALASNKNTYFWKTSSGRHIKEVLYTMLVNLNRRYVKRNESRTVGCWRRNKHNDLLMIDYPIAVLRSSQILGSGSKPPAFMVFGSKLILSVWLCHSCQAHFIVNFKFYASVIHVPRIVFEPCTFLSSTERLSLFYHILKSP